MGKNKLFMAIIYFAIILAESLTRRQQVVSKIGNVKQIILPL